MTTQTHNLERTLNQSSRIVPIIRRQLHLLFGVVVIVASVSKAYYLHNNPVSGSSWTTSRDMLSWLCAAEMAIGLFAISGAADQLARLLLLVMFCVLSVGAATLLIRGDTTCSCFGSMLSMPLWTMLCFDVLAVLVLWWTYSANFPSSRRLSWKACIPMAFGLTIVAIAVKKTALIAHDFIQSDVDLVPHQATKDFGVLGTSSSLIIKHSFTISNKGNRDIRILSAKASCGCTSVDFPAKAISPGQEIVVPVLLNWTGRTGPQFVEILLSTDSDKQPQIKLALMSRIQAGIVVSPAFIDFGRVSPGKTVTRIVEVADPTTTKLIRIQKIAFETLNVSAEPVQRNSGNDISPAPNASTCKLTFVAPSDFRGVEKGRVTFILEGEGSRSSSVGYRAEDLPELSLVPEAMLIRAPTTTTRVQRVFCVYHSVNSQVNARVAEGATFLNAQVLPYDAIRLDGAQASTKIALQVQFTAAPPKPLEKLEVQIQCGKETVKLPVSILR